MNTICGSMFLDGVKYPVQPGKNTFAGGLVAELEYRRVTPRAEFVLLRLKNEGAEDSARITRVRSLDVTLPVEGAVHYHSLQGDDCGATSFMPVNFDLTENYTEQPAGGRSSNTTGFPYFDLSWQGGAVAFGIG